MVAGDLLDQPALRFLEHREVLDQVEQPILRTDAPDGGVQRHHAGLAFVVDPLPVEEVLPARERAADHRLGAVGQHDEGVEVEQLRDGRAVVGEVVVVGRAQRPMRGLELHEQQRNAVDEADQVAAALVHVAADPDL